MFDNIAKWYTSEVDAAKKRGEQIGAIKATIEEAEINKRIFFLYANVNRLRSC